MSRHRPLIGSHATVTGGLAKGGLAYAEAVGAEVIQVFVSNPRGWAASAGDPEQDARLREAGLPVFVHAPYLINLGAADPAIAAKSARAVAHALERGRQIGARGVVVHTGSATGWPAQPPAADNSDKSPETDNSNRDNSNSHRDGSADNSNKRPETDNSNKEVHRCNEPIDNSNTGTGDGADDRTNQRGEPIDNSNRDNSNMGAGAGTDNSNTGGEANAEVRGRALRQVAELLLPLLTSLDTDDPDLLLEPMAGQGQMLCARAADLGPYLDALDRHPRVGVCLDTCHLFAAGHDLTRPGGVAETLAEAERAVGPDRVRLVHANDSQLGLGSRRDRHEAIGKGEIGVEPFRELLAHPMLKNVPFVAETPGGRSGHARDIALLKDLRDT